jgi:SNF2 family DNA or RNA helicase
MKLYGIDCLSIDGSMLFEKRAKIVALFQTENGPRVLIFSSVGSAGLNLTIACKVFLFVSGCLRIYSGTNR